MNDALDAGALAALPSDSLEVGALAQMACVLELEAPNPGNVRPGADLPGLRSGELMRSAVAIGPAMSAAGSAGLGRTILRAVRATRRWTDTNTNLGIVLLFAPLAAAAQRRSRDRTLEAALGEVLASTTVEDARLAYRAIRMAEPGGLGTVEREDVAGEPGLPLTEVMRLAPDHDTIAEQYATEFRLVREVSLPPLRRALEDGADWLEAALCAFLATLAGRPDGLIHRRFGGREAEELRAEAARILALGGGEARAEALREPEVRSALAELDRRLRTAEPPRNPGSTADLTAAALYWELLAREGRERRHPHVDRKD